MPLCQGLPTGPCPSATNYATVKSTQGDLFLCRSCEETRFPYVLVKGKGGRSTRNQNQPAQATSKSSSVEVQCTGCDKLCDRAECIKCDICSENYDQQCSALPKAVFTTLLSIAHVCGWRRMTLAIPELYKLQILCLVHKYLYCNCNLPDVFIYL